MTDARADNSTRAVAAAGPALDASPLPGAMVRLGLMAGGSYLLHVANATFWAQGNGMWNGESVVLSFLAYGLGFMLLGLGMAGRQPEAYLPLVLLAFLLTAAGSSYVSVVTDKPGAPKLDLVLFSSYAAHLLLLGENPYTWDLTDAYTTFGASGLFTTPMLDGSSASIVSYPALHFLLLVPVHALGLNGARVLYVFCYALSGALLFFRAPKPLRAVILLPLWVNPEYLGFPLSLVTDAVWALLVLGSVLTWRHSTWRAVFYGLACAYKQIPWLLAPFIFVRLLIDDEDSHGRPPLQRALFFFALAGLVFFVVNVPFMVADLPAWTRGVFQPLTGHLVYLGTGLVSTTLFGLVELPKAFYTAASLVVMLTLMLLYAANFDRWRHTLWLYPGLTLWFSYRSLQSYFVYWVPLLTAVIVEEARERMSPLARREADDESRGPKGPWHPINGVVLRAADWLQARRHWTPGVVAASLSMIFAAAVLSLASNKTVGVELLDARLGSSSPEVGEMEVLVHNTTDKTMLPRFAVQRGSWQPYPWDIVSGPLSLFPGERGRYRIETDLPYRTLPLSQGGQLVVSEASGDYRVRGTLKVPPDDSLFDPEAVFNANYLALADNALPWGWTLQQMTPETPSIEPTRTTGGLRAIKLGFQSHAGRAEWEAVGLAQGILFPHAEIRVWVNPPDPGAADEAPLSIAYGLEFHDGERRLWVLFAPSDPREGSLGETHYYIQRRVPAGAWSEQLVNLSSIYAGLGWPLPPLRRTVRGNVELLTRGTSFTLFVAARKRLRSEVLTAQFGPARIDRGVEAVRQQIRERVERRQEYYLALSQLESARRNSDRARELYEKATPSHPE